MGVRAIDVSQHQGHIDWQAVRASGVRAAWIKVGGADDGLYRDSRADENLVGARGVGIEVGTYYFCVPAAGNAGQQARHAVGCGHGHGQLWPAADLETNPNRLSLAQLDQWLAEFCTEVRHLTGRESIWYGGASTGVGFTAAAPRCPVWIANYGARDTPGTTPPTTFRPRVPPAWPGWDVWQFNSVTRVPGITANTCDQNVITDDFWARMTGAAPADDMEDLMGKAVICEGVDGVSSDTVWEPTHDGNGRRRRLGVASQDELAMLRDIGVIDGDPVTLTGTRARLFIERFPLANDRTADAGALALTMLLRADVAALLDTIKTHTATALTDAETGASIDPATLADRIATRTVDELSSRLSA